VFVAPEHLVRAKAATIRLGSAQLLMIGAQRRVWEKRMGELLLGGPRTGRDHTVKDPDPGKAFPGGEIYLSFPGLGDRLAARVAAEIGDHIEQFDTPASLQSYAGAAPVTRQSGKSMLVVSKRLACNRYLRDAVQQWAFCSLHTSGWSREFYDAKRASGRGHHAALRALGNRWLEVLWHCVTKGMPYEEEVHVANRKRYLAAA
jgi:transposase